MNKAEREHRARIAELGCMVCRRLGFFKPADEAHHKRGGQGGWGRGDYRTLIPLCWGHHQGKLGIHGLGTKAFPIEYGFTEQDLLVDVWKLLG